MSYYNSPQVPFYPESYLFKNPESDFEAIQEAFCKHALRSFFRILLRQHDENVANGWSLWAQDVIEPEKARNGIAFAFQQFENYTFTEENQERWKRSG